MKKIQSVEFEEVKMESATSIAVGTTLTIGKGKTAVTLSAQEVIELRDWLNELTGGKYTFPSAEHNVTGVVSGSVSVPEPELPANPLDTPAGYVPLESRGRGAIILPDGQQKVVPFVSDGRSDASTVAHRLPLDVALKKAGMELFDKSSELGKTIVVTANKTPKGARGDGK